MNLTTHSCTFYVQEKYSSFHGDKISNGPQVFISYVNYVRKAYYISPSHSSQNEIISCHFVPSSVSSTKWRRLTSLKSSGTLRHQPKVLSVQNNGQVVHKIYREQKGKYSLSFTLFVETFTNEPLCFPSQYYSRKFNQVSLRLPFVSVNSLSVPSLSLLRQRAYDREHPVLSLMSRSWSIRFIWR